MKIELISFGKISDFITNQQIEFKGAQTTDALKEELEKLFPQLAGIKYKLALNQSFLQGTVQLKDGDSLAIMPPFSGG
ncbi:MoaD/ThiS family protein [Pedobacter aquatilis]|uniref:MoaD/ThiS family protein n=1 Tax=Pedobacter aquatilis TaxID=351343 RepID=UPI00292CFB5E|nr:MoaD/ThiS family protein [Pedobacter aquatilis]